TRGCVANVVAANGRRSCVTGRRAGDETNRRETCASMDRSLARPAPLATSVASYSSFLLLCLLARRYRVVLALSRSPSLTSVRAVRCDGYRRTGVRCPRLCVDADCGRVWTATSVTVRLAVACDRMVRARPGPSLSETDKRCASVPLRR